MVDKLIKLYNTLAMIGTKGEDTKTMAQCLVFLEQTISEEQARQQAPVEEENVEAE